MILHAKLYCYNCENDLKNINATCLNNIGSNSEYKRYTNGVLDFHKEKFTALFTTYTQKKPIPTHQEKSRYRVRVRTNSQEVLSLTLLGCLFIRFGK